MDEGLCPFLLIFSRIQNTYKIAYPAMCSSFRLRAAQQLNEADGLKFGRSPMGFVLPVLSSTAPYHGSLAVNQFQPVFDAAKIINKKFGQIPVFRHVSQNYQLAFGPRRRCVHRGTSLDKLVVG